MEHTSFPSSSHPGTSQIQLLLMDTGFAILTTSYTDVHSFTDLAE